MATIYASVSGGSVEHDGQTLRSFRLQTAINRATPGDVIQLLPGRYTRSVVLRDSGERDKPITLRGQDDFSALLDGQQDRECALNDFDPMDDDFAFIQVQSADWLRIENLAFGNCWPSAIFVRGSKDLVISQCRIYGGRFGVYCRNRLGIRKTRRFRWMP